MAQSEQQQAFWVADWQVKPGLSEIERDGNVIQLEPKVMAVLQQLASQPGEVFSRQDLESAVWQGTVVGYDALAKAINKLREALGDNKKQPSYVQTISKKGYRLIAPVHSDETVQRAEAPQQSQYISSRWIIPGAAAFVIVVIALLMTFWLGDAGDGIVIKTSLGPVIESKPTIVVLPFRNVGSNKIDDYLAEGLTSDLTTNLSKLSSLWVTASNAALVYKNSDVPPDTIRQNLKVRYILGGEVNKHDENIRINVHLTDVETGSILWSERYDRQIDDLFAFQDEVANKIINSLSITLTENEKRRIARRYTHNLEAYDYFLRGQSRINMRTPEENLVAREMYTKAIELDPGFSRAYAGLAMTYTVEYVNQWQSGDADTLNMASKLSSRAIKMDNELPESYFVAAFVSGYMGNTGDAIKYLNQALSLNPNYADAYTLLAWNNISIGKPELALEYMAHALHLNPVGGYLYQIQLGKANYFLGNYDLALRYLEMAREGNPTFINTIYYMAATFVNLERYDDASWIFGEMQHTFPDFDIEFWLNNNSVQDSAFREKLRNDLAKAESHKPGGM